MSLLDQMPRMRTLAPEEVLENVGWALERGYAEYFERKVSRRGNVLTLTVRVRVPGASGCCRERGE